MIVTNLVPRNVIAERGRTSLKLEPELWHMLNEICQREGHDKSTLVRQIEASGPSGHIAGRTSAVRVYIAKYFYAAATSGAYANKGRCSLTPGQRYYPIELTASELAETAANLANQIEASGGPPWYDDDGQADDELCRAFMKFIVACEPSPDPIYVTTLMAKWAGILRGL